MNIQECSRQVFSEFSLPVAKSLPNSFVGLSGEELFSSQSVIDRFFNDQGVLPTIDSRYNGATESLLVNNGVKLLGELGEDKNFQRVNLPDGWGKIPLSTDRAGLFDNQGRKRFDIYLSHKVASCDRGYYVPAIVSTCRYTTGIRVDDSDGFSALREYVFDSGKAIIETTPIYFLQSSVKSYVKALDATTDVVGDYLKRNFPDFRDSSKYWDKK